MYLNLINYKVSPNKILDFYSIYYAKLGLHVPLEKINAINKRKCDGIVLGISHAEVGINPKYLSGNLLNLAMSSQDLFWNLKTLQILKKYYLNKIRDMKCVIIDMHKYTYFNYDHSRSNNSISCYLDNDFCGIYPHNFYSNNNIKKLKFGNKIMSNLKIEKSKIISVDKLFGVNNIIKGCIEENSTVNQNEFDDFPYENCRRKCI